MNCMRCGQEIPSGQVFCEECRIHMEKYPVNPDTPVHLPQHRNHPAPKKVVKRRTISAEDRIQTLQKRLRFFVIWSLIATLLVLAMAYPTYHYLTVDHFKPGQNYSPITTVTPVETEPA